MDDIAIVLKALRFAARKHRDQRRKDQNASPYINHPIAVAETLWNVGQIRDPVVIVAALLHDTVEDTDTSFDELESEFGKTVMELVSEVTDNKKLPSPIRKYLQVRHAKSLSPHARVLKLADKICNVHDIAFTPPANWSLKRRRDYVAWCESVVARIRGSNEPLETLFDEVCAAARKAFDEEEVG